MRILIAILVLTNFCELSGQTFHNFGETLRYFGKGTIDNKINITLELDAVVRPYYEEHCYIGQNIQFVGRYYANDKYEQYKNLVGNKITLFDEREQNDTITLFELDTIYNKISVFKGIIQGNNFSGIWNRKNDKNFNFRITLDSSNFSQLCIITSKGLHNLSVKTGNNFNQNDYRVLKVKEIEDKVFVLIKFNIPQCSALNCRGQGCGGTNLYLRLYEIQERGYKFQEYFMEGYGYSGKPRDLVKDEIAENQYTAKIRQYEGGEKESYYSVQVNFAEPHKGIIEIPVAKDID